MVTVRFSVFLKNLLLTNINPRTGILFFITSFPPLPGSAGSKLISQVRKVASLTEKRLFV